MNWQFFSLSLLSLSSFLTVAPFSIESAAAQCVMADISVQAAIHGSKQPAQQDNNVDMQSQGACVGNTSTHTSTQVYVGNGDKLKQQRTSSHRLVGGRGSVTGISGPTVAIPVEVKVDVYNPAARFAAPDSNH
ncbi:hypothetical protein [Chroococcidiopsis sp. CCMEE 29]|uniref:hypothetical protein n=1 Tax=Chroococcidiopsis sp. CCMEE 29 TaxID=155894 RepID=UPI0020225EF7|nr:hypothetical protein [Chroococcidiopsis sp. CCMEE 29]